MTWDAVNLARYNHALYLARALEAVASPEELRAEHFSNACWCYRVLGIGALLQEADVLAFADGLARAGQTRLALLRLAASGRAFPERFLIASDNVGFSDALAAGDLETARGIAGLAPLRLMEGWEYEDDFLFSRCLHLLFLTPGEAAPRELLLTRWAQVLEGVPDARWQMCRALEDRDARAFEDALDAQLSAWRQALREDRRSMAFDPELDATVGKIYVDGLALLRLAEMRGLTPPDSRQGLPSLARVPSGTPLPAPDAWRSFEP